MWNSLFSPSKGWKMDFEMMKHSLSFSGENMSFFFYSCRYNSKTHTKIRRIGSRKQYSSKILAFVIARRGFGMWHDVKCCDKLQLFFLLYPPKDCLRLAPCINLDEFNQSWNLQCVNSTGTLLFCHSKHELP